MADTFGLSERDVLLQVVPMFHANGWGKPYAAIMVGAKIVLPGEHPQPCDIAQLIQDERVTVMGAVPKFGQVKAMRLLNQCRISQAKTVGGLSDRQRNEIVRILDACLYEDRVERGEQVLPDTVPHVRTERIRREG